MTLVLHSADIPQMPITAPSSQDSRESLVGSYTSSQFAHSDASQNTLDTDLTSPPSRPHSSNHLTVKSSHTVANMAQSGFARNGLRLQTPEGQTDAARSATDTSPMSLASPVNGVKRLADGRTKSDGPSSSSSPVDKKFAGITKSYGASPSSKAGMAAAQLKTRLAYAMAKVQHGWEHKPIGEVEQLAAQLAPSSVVSSPGGVRHTHVRNQSLNLTNGASRLSLHDARSERPDMRLGHSASPPSKRRHAPMLSEGHALAPAAEISPSRHARHKSMPQPPRAGAHHNTLSLATPPTTQSTYPPTPKSAQRPGTLRTKTQTAQAEQDAMDALMLMGSPSSTGAMSRHQNFGSQQSSHQQSPLSTAPPRQALFYRNDSSESASSGGGLVQYAPKQARAAFLDDIEAQA